MDSRDAGLTVRTPDTMAALIPSNELYQAWTQHKTDMDAARMQRYNDALFERLSATLTSNADEIKRRLLATIRTSTHSTDLHIPIFTYRSRLYDRPPPAAERARLEQLCADNMWHWTLQLPGDTKPVSYYSVIRYTNICQRLSHLFSGNEPPQYWVTWRYARPVTHTEHLVVNEYELVLHYYPDGLSEARRAQVVNAAPAPAPVTPPRPVRIAPPPPPELLRYRRTGYVREYESVSDATRDLGEELLRECYCGYNSDSE